jgi:GT2 family glycosyltransferase
MPSLAVVLISKDQAWNMARLLESVLAETARLPDTEIVLVDSASADDTAEVAARYPIDVLRLRPDQPLTPAAGRYVGYHRTTAELVLFLDGDMELCPGWLGRAIHVIDRGPDVAAVTGELVDLPRLSGAAAKPALREDTGAHPRDVPYSGGAAMHRRVVLQAVGTFNPYLHSDEEPELCLRVRHAGYRIVQLDRPVAYHYSDPAAALSTVVARWRRQLYLGAGEAIRHNLRSRLLWTYVRERGYGLIPGLALTAGMGAFLRSARSRRWGAFGIWMLLLTGVIAGDACRKRSLRRTMHSVLERLLILDGTIRGFMAKPLDPRDYPARYDVIRQRDAR